MNNRLSSTQVGLVKSVEYIDTFTSNLPVLLSADKSADWAATPQRYFEVFEEKTIELTLASFRFGGLEINRKSAMFLLKLFIETKSVFS